MNDFIHECYFDSSNQCRYCGAPAPEPPTFLRRQEPDQRDAEIARLTAELAEWQTAFGTVSTLAGSMEIDAKNPQGMAQIIVAHVAAAKERERVLRDELSEAKAMLDYHVDKPVDTRDAVRKLGQHLANMCDEDQWPGVERLLNGLRETLRKRGVLGEP